MRTMMILVWHSYLDFCFCLIFFGVVWNLLLNLKSQVAYSFGFGIFLSWFFFFFFLFLRHWFALYTYARFLVCIRSITYLMGKVFFFFCWRVTKFSKWYQTAYVPKRRSSHYIVQEGEFFFEDATELNKWY